MKRRRIGLAAGLLGNLAFGWGLFELMGTGSCGAADPPCPDEGSGWPPFVAGLVGMIVSIFSISAGGGILFLTTLGTVGVASILRGLNGGVGEEGETTFPIVFGAVFLAPALLPLFFVPSARRQQKQAEWLRTHGKKAVATVTAVEDTGGTVNENPQVRLRLSIVPDGAGAAFQGETTMVVSRVDVPRPGDRYPVWYDPQDTTRFEIGDEIREAAPEPAAPATIAQDRVAELSLLNEMRMRGRLTDEEFSRAKDRLLSDSPPGPAAG